MHWLASAHSLVQHSETTAWWQLLWAGLAMEKVYTQVKLPTNSTCLCRANLSGILDCCFPQPLSRKERPLRYSTSYEHWSSVLLWNVCSITERLEGMSEGHPVQPLLKQVPYSRLHRKLWAKNLLWALGKKQAWRRDCHPFVLHPNQNRETSVSLSFRRCKQFIEDGLLWLVNACNFHFPTCIAITKDNHRMTGGDGGPEWCLHTCSHGLWGHQPWGCGISKRWLRLRWPLLHKFWHWQEGLMPGLTAVRPGALNKGMVGLCWGAYPTHPQAPVLGEACQHWCSPAHHTAQGNGGGIRLDLPCLLAQSGWWPYVTPSLLDLLWLCSLVGKETELCHMRTRDKEHPC